MPKQNYYEFFGLNNFEDDQLLIKKAYRSMALKWHPDRNQGNEIHADHMMKQVNEVFRILSRHKDEYDRHIGRISSSQRSEKSSEWKFHFDEGSFDRAATEEVLRKFYDKMNAERGDNWYKKYTNGDFGTTTREEARRKTNSEWDPKDHPRGKRTVGSTSLFSQQQAIEIIKAWTWDEFTEAKNFINGRREARKQYGPT